MPGGIYFDQNSFFLLDIEICFLFILNKKFFLNVTVPVTVE